MSAARKAPSRRVAPESTAGGVTRLVDIPISTAPRALPPIDSDSNAIRAGYAEAPSEGTPFGGTGESGARRDQTGGSDSLGASRRASMLDGSFWHPKRGFKAREIGPLPNILPRDQVIAWVRPRNAGVIAWVRPRNDDCVGPTPERPSMPRKAPGSGHRSRDPGCRHFGVGPAQHPAREGTLSRGTGGSDARHDQAGGIGSLGASRLRGSDPGRSGLQQEGRPDPLARGSRQRPSDHHLGEHTGERTGRDSGGRRVRGENPTSSGPFNLGKH